VVRCVVVCYIMLQQWKCIGCVVVLCSAVWYSVVQCDVVEDINQVSYSVVHCVALFRTVS